MFLVSLFKIVLKKDQAHEHLVAYTRLVFFKKAL